MRLLKVKKFLYQFFESVKMSISRRKNAVGHQYRLMTDSTMFSQKIENG